MCSENDKRKSAIVSLFITKGWYQRWLGCVNKTQFSLKSEDRISGGYIWLRYLITLIRWKKYEWKKLVIGINWWYRKPRIWKRNNKEKSLNGILSL